MVPRFSTLSSLPCESCQLGKHTRVSFPKRLNNRAKSPFELVHTDVWSPCRTAFTLGFQYFVTFMDDYSRLTMPREYFSAHLLRLCLIMGFFISLLVLYSFNKMGVAERKNRHLVETARTILLHSNIPHSLLFPDQPLYFLPPRVFDCTCLFIFSLLDMTSFRQSHESCPFPLSPHLMLCLLEHGLAVFSSVVQEFGMLRSTADHSVFYHHNSLGQCIYLVVYVDDIVITGSDQDAQSSSGVALSQRKYALDILEETGEPLGDLGRYRRLVGHTQVVGYTDADWAGSPTDRRSTSGYCVFIGGCKCSAFGAGNLVMENGNDSDLENFLWQSFDYPCDNLIPGMKAWNRITGLDWFLSPWKSVGDHSKGLFTHLHRRMSDNYAFYGANGI
ncbi:hypothetical protein CK203_096846 [Vitis vinifera]|uniref:Bulb-type lectin domain-containing protein n=1 Tax=Vitis vinifera TaxID=29760 RepID=A0A438BPN3_VITVI|nr:hypothetical protein CK203_096846 [Vitis vinifera]